MRECVLRIAYFSHFSILRKKKCENWYFRSISYPTIAFILSRWHRSAYTCTYIYIYISLSHSLFIASMNAPLLFSAKESGTNWLTSTRMASTCRGVTAVSAARLRGGSRGDRGESPKISRSGFSAVYRPPKSNLNDRHSPSCRAASVFNYPPSTESRSVLSLISVSHCVSTVSLIS